MKLERHSKMERLWSIFPPFMRITHINQSINQNILLFHTIRLNIGANNSGIGEIIGKSKGRYAIA